MVLAILKAFLIGICAAVPFGPIAVYVIQRSLVGGHKTGFVTSLGAPVVDSLYAAIAIFFVSYAREFFDRNEVLIFILGGLIVIGIGVAMTLSKPFSRTKKMAFIGEPSVKDFLKSLVLGVTNPGAMFMIFGLYIALQVDTTEVSTMGVVAMIAAQFVGEVTYWFFVTYAVSKLRTKFRFETLGKVNRALGLVVAVMGIVMFANGIYRLFSTLL